ncbi:hypothetical protein [Solimonas marina]|uniref:Uncharacterized protein n=1 Tax=Solimonas marina TaxID=2714601 RepID=A0A970B3S1_9GAMM|nr:hypothetical protein [Solimonas marina]NKF21562.1 hypothetical protein [Solimonas marina]
MSEQTLTKAEWIDRCAKRYRDVGGLSEDLAKSAAEVAYEVEDEDWGPRGDPEEAADEDMSCWDDDGDQ